MILFVFVLYMMKMMIDVMEATLFKHLNNSWSLSSLENLTEGQKSKDKIVQYTLKSEKSE